MNVGEWLKANLAFLATVAAIGIAWGALDSDLSSHREREAHPAAALDIRNNDRRITVVERDIKYLIKLQEETRTTLKELLRQQKVIQ